MPDLRPLALARSPPLTRLTPRPEGLRAPERRRLGGKHTRGKIKKAFVVLRKHVGPEKATTARCVRGRSNVTPSVPTEPKSLSVGTRGGVHPAHAPCNLPWFCSPLGPVM